MYADLRYASILGLTIVLSNQPMHERTGWRVVIGPGLARLAQQLGHGDLVRGRVKVRVRVRVRVGVGVRVRVGVGVRVRVRVGVRVKGQGQG